MLTGRRISWRVTPLARYWNEECSVQAQPCCPPYMVLEDLGGRRDEGNIALPSLLWPNRSSIFCETKCLF